MVVCEKNFQVKGRADAKVQKLERESHIDNDEWCRAHWSWNSQCDKECKRLVKVTLESLYHAKEFVFYFPGNHMPCKI